MNRFAVYLITLITVFGTAGSAYGIGFEVAVSGWAQDPDGQVSYQYPLATQGLDLVNEAGYDEEKKFSGRINLDLPVLPNICFMATPMEFEGNGNKSFSFGSAVIPAAFYSKSVLDHYDLALYYGVPLTGLASLGTLGIDLGINIRMLDIDVAVDDGGGNADRVSETLYVPMGYLAVQFKPFKKLAIEAELRGIAYSGNHYYDLIGRVKYKLAGPAFLAAGWRYEDILLDEKDIQATLEFSGPFAEAGFQF